MTKQVYKTARGKALDMGALILQNENVRAVGNMKVNARGDLIGNNGEIAMGRNQLMDQVYAVADAPAAVYSPNDPKIAIVLQAGSRLGN